jgi:hypothetical protein
MSATAPRPPLPVQPLARRQRSAQQAPLPLTRVCATAGAGKLPRGRRGCGGGTAGPPLATTTAPPAAAAQCARPPRAIPRRSHPLARLGVAGTQGYGGVVDAFSQVGGGHHATRRAASETRIHSGTGTANPTKPATSYPSTYPFPTSSQPHPTPRTTPPIYFDPHPHTCHRARNAPVLPTG